MTAFAKGLRTMASKPNYKQIFANKDKATRELLAVCPQAVHRSGIYFYTREDMDGRHGYIGKAVDLCERNCSHILGYAQRIDKSIKSRGFYSELNPSGWKLNVIYYPKSELDKWEQYWIEQYRNAGVHLYNVESGGTEGKTIIGERKPPKTYREGVSFGKKSLARELRHIIETHHFEIKPEKDNKISQKAIAKFWEILNFEN
jgi:hypothetical protein